MEICGSRFECEVSSVATLGSRVFDGSFDACKASNQGFLIFDEICFFQYASCSSSFLQVDLAAHMLFVAFLWLMQELLVSHQ